MQIKDLTAEKLRSKLEALKSDIFVFISISKKGKNEHILHVLKLWKKAHDCVSDPLWFYFFKRPGRIYNIGCF